MILSSSFGLQLALSPIAIVLGLAAGGWVLSALLGDSKTHVPGGSDPLAALRALAERVASDIQKRGASYDKALLRSFQAMAGIVVDGLYGPESALHLAKYINRTPPNPIYSGAPEAPLSTPPTLAEQDEAKRLAEDLDRDIKANGMRYNRDTLKRFQRLVRLYADGLYGPASAGALKYHLQREPPKPLYASKSGSYEIADYDPSKAGKK